MVIAPVGKTVAGCASVLVCLAAGCFFARSSAAALGDSAASVARDRKALAATHRATAALGTYTVQEMVSGAQTVREFVSSSGVVFAVAWNGRAEPDLGTLLGSYAPEYRSAVKQSVRKRGRRWSRVASDGVVVETWGHMGNVQGRAYAPALMPAGVNLHEIK